MELDDLKRIWKNDQGFEVRNEAELQSMLHGSSKSVIAKLKRNVWLELTFSFVASVLILIYAYTLPHGALKWTSISFIVLYLVYTVSYIKKLVMLSRFNPGEHDLKTSINQLIDGLTSYVKFYKTSYAVLYPVYFCLGLLFGLLDAGTEHFIATISTPTVIFYLACMAALFFFMGTWFTKWYVHKLWGMHIEKLKVLVADLNDNVPAGND